MLNIDSVRYYEVTNSSTKFFQTITVPSDNYRTDHKCATVRFNKKITKNYQEGNKNNASRTIQQIQSKQITDTKMLKYYMSWLP